MTQFMSMTFGTILPGQAGGINPNFAPQKGQGLNTEEQGTDAPKKFSDFKNLSPSRNLKKAQGNQATQKQDAQKNPNQDLISTLLNIILSLINPSQKAQGASTDKQSPLPTVDSSNPVASK
jgi:hypothetical protein